MDSILQVYPQGYQSKTGHQVIDVTDNKKRLPSDDGSLFYLLIEMILSSLLGSNLGSLENLSVHPLEDVCMALGSNGTTTIICRLHVVVLLL